MSVGDMRVSGVSQIPKGGCIMERRKEFLPWMISDRKTKEQLERQEALILEQGFAIGDNCYISEFAEIHYSTGSIGAETVIGANALIRNANIKMGRNCSVNSYAYLQGKIEMGDEVRIAPKASIIADNHGFSDITVSMEKQPGTSKGIKIGNDVWIGANAVITDGVTIGSHCIVGAGSVVTRNVPDYCVVGGSPARVLKNRIRTYFENKLDVFCNSVKQEVESLVYSYIENGAYVDYVPNAYPPRAWCDAIEILSMFNLKENTFTEEKLHEIVLNMQNETIDYGCLCVGYCLENLGSHIQKPYADAIGLSGEKLKQFLEQLDWERCIWESGSNIDELATAFYHNKKYFDIDYDENTLFTWLNDNVNPENGMWGTGKNSLQIVNGFYRLTRGTYAQFNRKLPMPEKVIDTILSHIGYLSEDINHETACNVLDIIHPLWLARKQTEYRSVEGKEFAILWINKILENWVEEKGFAFILTEHSNASLMGTEMWLSILYLLCDYLGIADLLNYSPKGVHRLYTNIK